MQPVSLQYTSPKSLSLGVERMMLSIHRLRYPDGFIFHLKSHASHCRRVGDDGLLIEHLLFELKFAGDLQRLSKETNRSGCVETRWDRWYRLKVRRIGLVSFVDGA